MTRHHARLLVAFVVVLAFGAAQLPAAIIPPTTSLVAIPARHRPHRGASRDRSKPGKARRRARRQAA